MQDELNERVAVFFDFMFGDEAIPVRTFDDDDAEMAFLNEGGLYGTMGECQAHGGLSPFVVTLGYHDELVWRGTCMQCWTQLRVPAAQTDGGWELEPGESRMVALDPVPDFAENDLTTDAKDTGTDAKGYQNAPEEMYPDDEEAEE